MIKRAKLVLNPKEKSLIRQTMIDLRAEILISGRCSIILDELFDKMKEPDEKIKVDLRELKLIEEALDKRRIALLRTSINADDVIDLLSKLIVIENKTYAGTKFLEQYIV